jgi:hypothetical protein|nr:hypothetical protein [Deltaproteobacteria bacterium]
MGPPDLKPIFYQGHLDIIISFILWQSSPKTKIKERKAQDLQTGRECTTLYVRESIAVREMRELREHKMRTAHLREA